MLKKSLILSLSLLSLGCVAATPDNLDDYSGKVFELSTIDGHPAESRKQAYIMFSTVEGEYRASGNLGCNNFSGLVLSDGNKLILDRMITTRMMCDPSSNEVEKSMMKSLNSNKGMSYENGVFKIDGYDNKLIFTQK